MTTATATRECPIRLEAESLPDAFVVSFSTETCGCTDSVSKTQHAKECAALRQSFTATRIPGDSFVYEYRFTGDDFASGRVPLGAQFARVELTEQGQEHDRWISACLSVHFKDQSGTRQVSWQRTRIKNPCNIGLLRRRRTPRGFCCLPLVAELNTTPTPDYAPPCPEWMRAHPDDLSDARFWPTMDVGLMQDSPEVGVRYANGELQLRIKDVGSDGFGVPWGHTRIYSNRLSNSYDFGNGTNWLIHEWPQLLLRNTDPAEVELFQPNSGMTPTGRTIVFLRGTRNSVWFDELQGKKGPVWRPRFGAKHTLEFDDPNDTFRLTFANGHQWEFYAFSPPCKRDKDSRNRCLDGKLIKHIDPGGHSLDATYKNGRLSHFERTAEGVTEKFEYQYFCKGPNRGRLQYVTCTRGKPLVRVEYTYYGAKEDFGSCGDLKTACAAYKTSEGWKGRPNNVHYYRYWTNSSSEKTKAGKGTYCQGLLRFLVSPETYHRLCKAGHNPLTVSNDTVAKFADIAIDYYGDSDAFQSRRVQSITMAGGSRKHFFDYKSIRADKRTLGQYKIWRSTTEETCAEGFSRVVCSNHVGQTLRHDLIDGGSRWTHLLEYHPTLGGVVSQYFPSSIDDQGLNPVRDQWTAWPKLQSKEGKVRHFGYFAPDKSKAIGFLHSLLEQAGIGGQSQNLASYTYKTVSISYNVYALQSERKYGISVNEFRLRGDGETTFDYEFGAQGTNSPGVARLIRRTTLLPLVASDLPAPLKTLTERCSRQVVEEFDAYGNQVKLIDARKAVTERRLDIAKGCPKGESVRFRDQNGNAKTLEFSYISDDLGRITEALGPHHDATRIVGMPEASIRSATWYLYKAISGEVWVSQGYAIGSQTTRDSPRVCVDPVAITKFDLANRVTDQIVASRGATTRPSIDEAIDQSKWVQWTSQQYSTDRTEISSRVYHDIPAFGPGLPQTATARGNFAETKLQSKIAQREKFASVTAGTCFYTRFNACGRPTTVHSGISPSQMVPIANAEYDNDLPGGNGNLTKFSRDDGLGTTRVTSLEYDSRDRQTLVQEPDGNAIRCEFNGHHSVAKVSQSSGLASKALLYDARERVIAKQLNGFKYVDPSAAYEPITERYHYDDANQLVAIELMRVAGTVFVVFEYDGLGRETCRRLVKLVPTGVHAHEQVNTSYNSVGDPVLVTTLQSVPVEMPYERTAYLGNLDGVDLAGRQGATPALVSSVGYWYDPLGRLVASSNFGSEVFSNTRPPGAAAQHPSTVSGYSPDGRVRSLRDELGRWHYIGRDNAGRVIAAGSNLAANEFQLLLSPLGESIDLAHLKFDATASRCEYTPEGMASKSRFSNTSTGPQVAKALNGTRPSLANSPVAATLPTATSTELNDSRTRGETRQYNRCGEVILRADANGTVHSYEYDANGRVVADVILYADESIDQTVKRISYGYDSSGRLRYIQSYQSMTEDPSKRLNQVVREYGSFNELIVEAQFHAAKEAAKGSNIAGLRDVFNGEVPTAAKETDPTIGLIGYYYDYNDVSLAAVRYFGDGKRRAKSGYVRYLQFYNPLMGRTDDSSSESIPGRVEILDDSNFLGLLHSPVINTVTRYSFCGADVVYGVDVKSFGKRVIGTSLGVQPPFADLDELGRQVRCRWGQFPSFDGLDDFSVSFDLDSSVLWRRNRLTKGQDDLFSYDRLTRLQAHDRGKLLLNGNKPAIEKQPAFRKLSQEWVKDQSSNWIQWRRNDFLSGLKVEQSRTHDRGNQILRLRGSWPTPKYDAAGLMTSFPDAAVPEGTSNATYDAWGRLVEYVDSEGLSVRYEYDGLGRRTIQRTHYEERHFYYDQAGQVISEMVGTGDDSRVDREYIWDPNTAGQLFCRVRYLSDGGEPERLYPLYDMLGNVTAIVNEHGDVQERYMCDPQGHVTYLKPDFGVSPTQHSEFEWQHCRIGLCLDRLTGLYFLGPGVYFHAGLGMPLPLGQILALPDSELNSYAEDFPFGDIRPPGIMGRQSTERMLKWISGQPTWLKVTIGGVLLTVTVGGLVLGSIGSGGALTFNAVGATAGALQGGIGASLSGGDYGDVILGAGIGAAFGAVCPWGGIGSLAGSAVGLAIAGTAISQGESWVTFSQGWELGGMIGGVVGGSVSVARSAAQRPLLAGLMSAGPDLLGAGAGAILAYGTGGDLNTVMHRATQGMMLANLSGAAVRGAWGARRAVAPKGRNQVIYNLTDDFEKIVQSERVWGLTEGSVYGLRTRQWWRGWLSRFDMPTRDPGVITFVDDAANLFHPHPIEGPFSLAKRLFGQQKAGFGDIVIDMSTATRNGNELVVRNARIGPHVGQSTQWALWRLRARRFGIEPLGYSLVAYGGYKGYNYFFGESE